MITITTTIVKHHVEGGLEVASFRRESSGTV
jgi:hypothetical protein